MPTIQHVFTFMVILLSFLSKSMFIYATLFKLLRAIISFKKFQKEDGLVSPTHG